MVSQKIFSTFSFDRPTTSIFGTPANSRRTTVASGSASPALLLADGEGGNRARSITIFAFGITVRRTNVETIALLCVYLPVTSNRCFRSEPH